MTIGTKDRRTLLQSTSTAVGLIIASISIPALAYDAADDISDVQHSDSAGHNGSSSDSQSHDSEAHDSGSYHQQGGAQGQKGKRRDPGTAGSTKGDSFGDFFAVLRDGNGIPILTPEGFVRSIDADGHPIPLDVEGAPITPSLAIKVEPGRLNIGRAPNSLLYRRTQEVFTLLNAASFLTAGSDRTGEQTTAEALFGTVDLSGAGSLSFFAQAADQKNQSIQCWRSAADTPYSTEKRNSST
tara:strand:- start:819 stop:1541 length:723 start_codon:yes stop_codon:yes gene_type:complete